MALPIFDGSKFTWMDGNGSSFASDLGWKASDTWPEQFYIKSHKTGAMKLFLPGTPLFAGHGEDREFVGATYFVPGGNIEIRIWNT